GLYTFTDLLPGDYIVQVTPPAGYELSPLDQGGNDQTDSDGSQSGPVVVSPVTTLTVGGETGDGDDATDPNGNNDPTVDFGFYQPVSLGDYIWFDENADGTQDAGETPILGAVVELYDVTGTTIVTDINGSTVASQTTGIDGLYFFDNLRPGDYVVRVTPPTGYLPTTDGGDPDNDDNTDSNGQAVAGQTYVQSLPVTLEAGNEPTDDGDTSNNSNLSIDFGFVVFDLALRKTVASTSNTPLIPGASTVTFNIEIINQGNITATNVSIVDYVQTGFTFNAGDNTGWDGTNVTTPTFAITGDIAPGAIVTQTITLAVDAGTLDQTLENYAEILSADDPQGNSPAADVDSTPETTQANGNADPTVDNEINDDGDIDEDDSDKAMISVERFDLALVKRLSGQSETPINPGTTLVTYTIEVFNQGDTDLTDSIQVVDYPQAGLTFDAALNTAALTGNGNDWLTVGTTPTLVIDNDIAVGGSVTVDIVLRVDAGTQGQTLYNFAEIADDGQPGDADPDSTPDSANDEAVDPLDPTDDVVKDGETAEDGQTNPADDEDDHDVESIEVPTFDLALVKTVNSMSDTPLVPGSSTVTFDITVFNQGDVAARNIDIVDYIVAGDYTYDSAVNPDWTQAATTTPTTTIAGPLLAGDSLTTTITLRVASGTAGTDIENYAEITSAEDANGNTPVDLDSTPDTNDANDGTPKDNFTSEDAKTNPGVDDEDDHDIATLTVGTFDLALVKRVESVSSTPILPTDLVTFTIEVYNQGDITATAPITIVDYVQAGFTFDPANNGTWDGTDVNNPVYTINSDIAPGQSATAQIILTVDTGTAGDTLYNFAEIAGDGPETDPDSTPDSTNDEAGADPLDPADDDVKDDVTLEDGLNVPGEDEDDHDVATIDVSQPVTVGNYVWIDANVDGTQDEGTAAGLAGATVTLFVTTDGGATLVAATDIDGTAVVSQTTGADGLYEFGNLAPGEYVVQVTPPAGYALTIGGSDPDNDDNTDSNGVAVAGQDYVQSLPVLLTVDGEPTDDDDTNADDNNSNQSVDFGFFQPVSLGDYVWFDQDIDGVQGGTEPGLAGVRVELFLADGVTPAEDVNGDPVLAVTTDVSGTYAFTNLVPGDYVVQIVPPAGYASTVGGADPDDDDNTDSNGLPVGDVIQSLPVTLSVGGESGDGDANDNNNDSVDFGLYQPVSVGNFVWYDQDADGTQDVGEPGIEGAVVELFQSDGVSAVTDASGAAVISQTTDASGLYLFEDLLPGDYVVRVAPPAGYGPSPVQVGDPNTDDNTDSNIASGAAGSYQSAAVTLSSGLEPTDDGDTDTNSNLSVDFGFVAFDLALRKTVASTSDTPLIPGVSTVTFNIEVINQGGIDASNIEVLDYVDTAMFGAFDTALNPNGTTTGDAALTYTWFTNASGGLAQLNGTLAAGQAITLPVTLQVAATTTQGDQLANFAEISTADDALGNSPATDIDSQPEAVEGDTNGDPLVDNEVDDEGNTDEDDHDVAYITIDAYDLALIKTLSGQSDTPLVAGSSTVTFEIEIFNQGDVTATAPITIVDYVDPAMFTMVDGNWTAGDANEYVRTIDTDIGPGASAVTTIELQIVAGTAGTTLRNFAEIADDGQTAGTDVDSTPDTISGNDGTVEDGTVKDNVTAEDGKANPGVDDEDDHDYADVIVPIFDLALVKVVNSASDSPLIPGVSTVTFDVIVYNQGSVTATNVVIADYIIGTDYSFDAAANIGWSTSTTAPTYTLPMAIAPGGAVTTSITLNVVATATGTIDNYAEVVSATDQNNNPTVDVDSTPDSTNDELTDGDPIKDNFTEEDALANPGVDDEDDHDIAQLTVGAFDLALVKRIDSMSSTPILPNGTITYTIEVFNQGDIVATAPIEIVDYLDTASLTYVSGGWNTAGANPVYTINSDIDPGQSTTISLVVTVNTATAGTTITNTAEIADDGPGTDIDSTPDTDNTEDPVKPGVTSEDGLGNPGVDDEDDHDLVTVTVAEPVSLGDYVWFDEDVDGFQDVTENGLAGALVELFVTTDGGATLTAANDIDGNPVTAVTAAGGGVTDVDGAYLFENLAPGEYVVRVTPPVGYVRTIGGDDPDDNDNTDSNGLAVSGETYYQSLPVVLGVDQEPTDDNDNTADDNNGNMSVDFGFFQPVSLGDYVWLDQDADGVQDGTEPGLAGAVVELFEADGVTPVVDAMGQTVLAQTTAADGLYQFDDLLPGDYVVQVVPPAGYEVTTGGADPDDNVNDDSNGVQSGAVVKSQPVTLSVGGETGDGDADDNNNDSVDFGFYQPVSLGDYVWFDEDADGLQDGGEAPITGATVELFSTPDNGGTLVAAVDDDGVAVPSQVTGPDGLYYFDNLTPGDYVVRVTPPTGYVPTTFGGDPDDNNNDDSNGQAVAGQTYVETQPVTLSSGQEPDGGIFIDGDTDPNSNLSVDFGFLAFDLALRKTVLSVSDTPLIPDVSTVTFNIEVINQGNIDASSIRLADTWDTSMFKAFNAALNPNGITSGGEFLNYIWAATADGADVTIAGTLPAGDSLIVPITLEVAAGTLDTTLENYAEIATASDGLGNTPALDVDSTVEDTEANGNADPLVDNEINDGGDTDEDDHDVAMISVDRFDLALVKRLSQQSETPLVPGMSTITFTIEIFNQGDITLTDSITVVDYVQTGFTFSAADNTAALTGNENDWTGSTTAPTLVIDADIPPGGSTSVDIVLSLDALTDGMTLYNFAEIADDGQPLDAAGNPVADEDSTPDSTNDEADPDPLDPTDDNVKDGETAEDGRNNPGDDEDDHDIASVEVPVFDLALVKTVASQTDIPLVPGQSTVTFDITVYNQGDIAARDIEIVDYIVDGDYVYDPALNVDWTQAVTAAPTTTLEGPLLAGSAITTSITLRVAIGTAGEVIENYAEVASATDNNGNVQNDIDSTPDSTNDELTDGDPIKDNFTSEDAKTNPGVDDEDDHDIAVMTVGAFDLALVKRFSSASEVSIDGVTLLPTSLVTFTIEVFNQGDITATAPITVVDYVQAGLTFTATNNVNWVGADGATAPTIQLTNDIPPGASATVDIVLGIDAGTVGQTLYNFAEIAEDGPETDPDSTPDATNDEAGADPLNPADDNVEDDETLGDPIANPGEDEDDHDVATVQIAEAVAVGNYIWIDADVNGTQDGGEDPIADGTVVGLYVTTNGGATLTQAVDIDGNLVPSTTTTAGIYSFTDLPPGEYVVRVVPPAGYALTTGGSDPDDNSDTDSNGRQVTGQTYVETLPVTLLPGEEPTGDAIDQAGTDENGNGTVDIGFFQPVAIGNFIWFDADGDGQQGPIADEPALENARVELFLGDGVTPAVDAFGNTVPAQTTGISGTYIFTDLLPGEYVVQVTPPAGYAPTVGGADVDADDSNTDSNGVVVPTQNYVQSLPVTLTSGGEPTNDGDTDNNTNLSVDFGFVQPLSVGNYVWYDVNGDGVQDADESGIPGAIVELFVISGTQQITVTDVTDSQVVSQTTDAGGFYLFEDLLPGDYVVRVTPPAGYAPTNNQVADPDNDDNTDTNIDNSRSATTDGYYESGVFTLASTTEPVDDGDTDNNSNLSIDFGFIGFDLALRKTVNSTSNTPLIPGASTVTFDIAVINQGQITATGVQIVDFVQSGFTFNGANNVTWDGTDATAPVFNIAGNIAPGETVTTTITLDVDLGTLDQTLENYAEVLTASTTLPGIPAIDVDSQPEADENDMNGDPLADNVINDDGDADEDDHDIALISVERFDLALVKRFTSQSDTPIVPGTSTVTFTIEIFNQGDVTMTDAITVVDYINLVQFTLADGDWDGTNPAAPTIVVNDDIAPGSSTSVDITLLVNAGTDGQTLLNYAEIAGDSQPGNADPDSNPDTIDNNDGIVKDNETAEDGEANPSIDDEDDHDVAELEVPVFDLALVKTISSLSDTPLIPGVSTVTFDVTVFNQGDITAQDITIVDYVIAGDYVYTTTGQTDAWSASTSAPTITIPGPIAPGASVTRTITLQVDAGASGQQLDNFAEIVSATDVNGATHVDIDSTPDAIDNNDGDPKDNFTGEDGKTNPGVDDEDDHDVAMVTAGVFDLALNKRVESTSDINLVPGSIVTYTIEIYNQGDITATASITDPILIVDYLDTSVFTLVSTEWDNTGASPTLAITNDILAGQSTTVELAVSINNNTAGQTLSNYAEILDDGIGIDHDSQPEGDENDSGTTGAGDLLIDDEIFDDGTADEDDHDIAQVTVVETVSVGNYVWIDSDADGSQNEVSTGLDNVTVKLLVTTDGGGTFEDATDINGALVPTQTTTGGGYYHFDNLAPGEYAVRVTIPDGYAPTAGTTVVSGADPDDNSDIDSNGIQVLGQNYVQSLPVILTAGGEPQSEANGNGGGDPTPDANSNLTVDFGFVELLSIGNVVWYDTNDDGMYDSGGETGIEGVELQLLNGDGTPYMENGAVVTTTTNAAGIYSFTNLISGTYRVQVVTSNFGNGAVLDNHQSSSDPATGATPDNDVDNDDNGPGRVGGSLTSGLITLTYDGEPITDGDTSTSTNYSVDFGFFEPLSLGNQVWIDLDNSGTIDASEDGADGVTVNLYRDGADGSTPNGTIEVGEFVTTTTTDDGGYYLFDNLITGEYVVEIPAANFAANAVLDGYYSSDDRTIPAVIGGDVDVVLVDDDDNGIDDADPATNGIRSNLISLAPQTEPQGETNLGPDGDGSASEASSELTADFGFVQPVTVGDRVWYDYNADGVQDNDTAVEPGVGNVQVNIFNADDDTLVTVDLLGNPVSTATTNASGIYSFTNLPPGDYYVTFVTTTLPAGYVISDPGLGGDDAEDSDADTTSGQTPSTGFLASGEEDLTLDMGIHALVSVGDRVWYDFNNNGIQDADGVEDITGVEGVEAQLYNAATNLPVLDAGGQPLTDVTDGNGNYLFENLEPGSYYVVFVTSTLPAGYEITIKDVDDATDAGDAVDSDADPISGQTDATPFLTGDPADANNSDLTLDMGVFGLVAVGDTVWYDNDRDGIYEPEGPDGVAGSGDDELGVEGVVARLYNGDGTAYIGPGETAQYTTTTNADGKYLFTDLLPGDYFVEFDLTTLPANYQVTEQDEATATDETDSDADPVTGRTGTTAFLPNGTQDITLDMGIWAPVTVGDRVWVDTDGDGTQDATETEGVEGVTVEVFNDEGISNGTTTTDASGYYTFTNLVPDDYYVIFDLNTLPVTYTVTFQDVTAIDDALDSDADRTTGQTAPTGFLFSNEEDLTLDMGVYIPVRVGDYVWYDEDRDGIQDDPADEPGVEFVTVMLYELGNSTPISTTTTDATGFYVFEELPPNDYYVVFDLNTLPPVYVPTTPNVNEPISDTVDSDANLSTGATAPTGFLNSGEEDLTLDMGILLPADVRVGDTVWDDLNADGVQDIGEPGVEGVRVELFEVGGTEPISDTLTDVNGTYLFEELPPGDYYVQFDLTTLPVDYVVTTVDATNPLTDTMDSDADPVTGITPSTGPLTTGDQDLTLDMGIYKPASLGDFVWFDDDADGIQDPGENGIENVAVEIFNGDGTSVTNASGNPVGPTTTDVNGSYAFTDLVPGDYYVVFTPLADHIISPQDTADDPDTGDDTVDSDANADRASADYGRTATTTLISGENDPTWDAGMYIPLALGNVVWFDPDNDGLYEPADGEMGIADVVVELYDADNSRIMTTTTDATGFYLFDELAAGDYSVVIAPSNFEAGGPLVEYLSSTPTENDPNAGPSGGINNDDNGIDSANMDSNGIRSGMITLSVGNEPTDDDHAGHPDSGAIVATDANTNLTVDFGFYEPLSLGNQVWLDSNDNGVVDGTEAGIDGVVVNLYRDDDQDGTPDGGAIDSQTTADGGFYLFDNLSEGFYVVEIDSDNFQPDRPLDNLASSKITATDPNTDADDNDDNGLDDTDPATDGVLSGTIELTVDGEPPAESPLGPDGDGIADDDNSNMTVDFGFYEPLSLGNIIWHDADNDGTIDAGETGVDGVTVNLYLDADQNGVADGAAIASQTTADGGYYLFDDLLPNSYIVEVDAANFQGANPLVGYLSSQTTEASPNDDVDSNDNGLDDLAPATNGIKSATVTLLANAEPISETDLGTLGDGSAAPDSSNLTVDFGFFQPVSVGDLVWNDSDADGVQELTAGETGVPNVTVNLLNSADGSLVTDVFGNPVGATTTDSDGLYTFENLPPGDYYVVFDLVTLPTGYVVTTQDAAGVADEDDSDADATTGRSSDTGFLPSGSNDPTLDMGIYLPLSVGDTVWYDYDIDGIQDFDDGEKGVPGVSVTIYYSDTQTPVIIGGAPYQTTTDSNGNYLFTGLEPNAYYVSFDLDTLPTGYTITVQNSGTDDLVDSDVYTSTGTTTPTPILTGGDVDLSLDMGIYSQVAVGDYVWFDDDFDGNQDPDEGGVPGIQVTLYSTTTNTPVSDPANPGTPWTVETDADGHYLFDALPVDGYYVVFDLATIPDGYQVTKQNVVADVSDSDADPNTGQSGTTGQLDNGSADLTLDMGIYKLVSVGDKVWFDNDADGQQDAGEPGVPNVTVTLYQADGTATGLTETTDANGNYLFENLEPGDYYVVFDPASLPANHIITTQDAAGVDNLFDSDADPTTGQTSPSGFIPSGEAYLGLDMGIIGPVSIGNRVWYDTDRDGLQDDDETQGVANVTVRVYTFDGQLVVDLDGNPVGEIQTDDQGNYMFENLPPGAYMVEFDVSTVPGNFVISEQSVGANSAVDSDASLSTGRTAATFYLPAGEQDLNLDMGVHQPIGVRIGDFVWEDLNGDGIQDLGEPGVGGVTVELWTLDADGKGVYTGQSVPTDQNGGYLFDEMPAGEYYVVFDLETLPDGYAPTIANKPLLDDSLDSDADPQTGQTPSTGPLTNGQQDLTLDMGVYRLASLGDTVWLDGDADGIQETGEPGVEGVTAELFNGDGTSTGLTTTTDADGKYSFTNLAPGDYYVRFTLPDGFTITSQNQGVDDAVDSDVDAVTQQTPVTTLISGENDPSWDMGIFKPAAIGNYVWSEDDGDGIQEAGEEPLENVTVQLYNSENQLIATMQTDSNGYYGFTDLDPGDYYVQFVSPVGLVPTQSNQGDDDTVDSDVEPTTGRTSVTTLDSDEFDSTWDAGFTQPASLGNFVWLDVNKNGIKDEFESGVGGVTVVLYDNQTGDIVDTTTTDNTGFYQFTNLAPGDYYLDFEPTANFQFTQQGVTGSPTDFNSDADPETGLTESITLEAGEDSPDWGAGLFIEPTALDETDEPDDEPDTEPLDTFVPFFTLR
ncbi:MAG: SdrD B-like domain-containing protein, partial [Chloroflexota bacterium]